MAKSSNVKKYPKSKYYQVVDGEWVDAPWKGFKEQCCSCGLIHRVDYRLTDSGGLQFRATVDNRATAAARRQFEFTKEDD